MNGLLSQITAARGESASLTYGHPSDANLVTEITLPGAAATFAYKNIAGSYFLTNITDAAGLSTGFTYRQDADIVFGGVVSTSHWRP